MKRLFVSLLAAAHAVGSVAAPVTARTPPPIVTVMPAIVAANTANAAARADAPHRTPPMAVCIWQVPQKSHWVNLYSVTEVIVSNRMNGGFTTNVRLGSFRHAEIIEIDIPRGTDVKVHLIEIEKRLDECRAPKS